MIYEQGKTQVKTFLKWAVPGGMRKLALVFAFFIVVGLLLVAASIVFGMEPAKSLLHIEKTETRATISCVDHKPPTVRSFKNEPLVVVDCERTK